MSAPVSFRMLRLVLVMTGGALGSAARYLLGRAVQARLATLFPAGTLVVNLLGCAVFGFVIGAVLARPNAMSVETRLFLLVGICGGFTTFSSFGYETFELLREGHLAFAFANVVLQLVLGVGAVWLGMTGARLTLT